MGGVMGRLQVAVGISQIFMALLERWQCFWRNSLTDGLNLSTAVPNFTHEAGTSHVGEVLLSYLATHTYFPGCLEIPRPREASLLL